MSAPKKSTRPRSRTRKVEDEAKINSGSTRSIDGLNMSERALTAKQKKLDKNNDGKISGDDFKKPSKMKGGGRAKAKGYAMGGGPTAAETKNRRLGQAIDDDEAVTKKYAERGTSGEAQRAKEFNALLEKFTDDELNIDRYGKDAPKGRSFGQKTRDKKPKVKMKGGGRAKAKGYAVGGKVKAKGMAMGGKIKSKGMAMGGKIKSKGMAMGGKVMSKGYAMGGKVRSKGEATGGAGFGAARFSGKGTQIF